jgi:3-oxoacyl-[acyl-carrier protein] reductase
MLIRFDDRTVIVTGAAHGFGRTIALNFATFGANVVACDLVKNGLEETARLATERRPLGPQSCRRNAQGERPD